MLIDGDWVDAKSGDTFHVYNPATGEVLSNVAAGDHADIDLALTAGCTVVLKPAEQTPFPPSALSEQRTSRKPTG
jgi:acyl-CoA reductase-like NAD-dependent aldehyde dehydrogenase